MDPYASYNESIESAISKAQSSIGQPIIIATPTPTTSGVSTTQGVTTTNATTAQTQMPFVRTIGSNPTARIFGASSLLGFGGIAPQPTPTPAQKTCIPISPAFFSHIMPSLKTPTKTAQAQAILDVSKSLSCVKMDARIPTPPNWESSLNIASQNVTSAFTKTLIEPSSKEYQVLASLLADACIITAAHRVVNPELWKRFQTSRKDLLVSKSEDPSLLSELGLSAAEIGQRTLLHSNFRKHPAVASSQYGDNVVLLFHCTKKDETVDAILSQGLDERLGRDDGGLLGKGIYFSDDPLKSMHYDGTSGTILVFAVYLGDCASVDHVYYSVRKTWVREPEKAEHQKRNPTTDLFFDSIVGRPRGSGYATYNEYVVFGRSRCVPLYIITYDKTTAIRLRWNGQTVAPEVKANPFFEIRKKLPPFTWKPPQLQGQHGGESTMSILPPDSQEVEEPWPFYARVLFEAMKEEVDGGGRMSIKKTSLPPPTPMNTSSASTLGSFLALRPFTAASSLPPAPSAGGESEESIQTKLAMLREVGSFNDGRNRELLKIYKGDVDAIVNYLLGD